MEIYRSLHSLHKESREITEEKKKTTAKLNCKKIMSQSIEKVPTFGKDPLIDSIHELRDAVKEQTRIQVIHWALNNLELSLAHHVSEEQDGAYVADNVPNWKYAHLNRRTRFCESLNPAHFVFYEAGATEQKQSHVFAEYTLCSFLRGSDVYIDGRSTDPRMSDAGHKDFREKFAHLLSCLTGKNHRMYEYRGRHMIAFE
jgi:hypothetical protein